MGITVGAIKKASRVVTASGREGRSMLAFKVWAVLAAFALRGILVLLCTGILAGVGTAQRKAQSNLQKVASGSVQYPPTQVFEAALRVAAKFGYTSEVDRKAQVVSFSIGPVGKAGSDYLTAFFPRLAGRLRQRG